jgi:hypothetical protein
MSAEPGEDESDTVHLSLKLPRGMTPARITTLIADLEEVHSVRLD